LRGAPLNYPGGKYWLAAKIIPLIPPHTTYVEVFGGAAHLLFRKSPSRVEVYNDINGDIVNFFRVLRDPEKSKRLQELLCLTPYSREEWIFCRDSLNDAGIDDVERARRFFVKIRQSFNGKGETWGYDVRGNRGITRNQAFYKIINCFPEFHERIRNIQVENDDFEKVIRRYDTPDTFFFCDPPYIGNRVGTEFLEMPVEDHERLVEVLLSIEGKAMLCGYENEIYKVLERRGWKKIGFTVSTYCTNPNQTGGKRRSRREYVWINYVPPSK
jgi:DNA adenine methylase